MRGKKNEIEPLPLIAALWIVIFITPQQQSTNFSI